MILKFLVLAIALLSTQCETALGADQGQGNLAHPHYLRLEIKCVPIGFAPPEGFVPAKFTFGYGEGADTLCTCSGAEAFLETGKSLITMAGAYKLFKMSTDLTAAQVAKELSRFDIPKHIIRKA